MQIIFHLVKGEIFLGANAAGISLKFEIYSNGLRLNDVIRVFYNFFLR